MEISTVTEYAADVSSWARWQQGYRFGVILIVPPDPCLSAVNALRARYSWSQSSKCDAHISLTVPVPGPMTQSHWNELQAITSRVKPFVSRYGPLKHYLPHPGVCLDIEPQAELDELRIAIESASCFADAKSRRFPFSAHMTIAEKLTVDQTHAIMADLRDEVPQGDFVCNELTYLVPDEDFRLTDRGRLPLMRDSGT